MSSRSMSSSSAVIARRSAWSISGYPTQTAIKLPSSLHDTFAELGVKAVKGSSCILPSRGMLSRKVHHVCVFFADFAWAAKPSPRMILPSAPRVLGVQSRTAPSSPNDAKQLSTGLEINVCTRAAPGPLRRVSCGDGRAVFNIQSFSLSFQCQMRRFTSRCFAISSSISDNSATRSRTLSAGGAHSSIVAIQRPLGAIAT